MKKAVALRYLEEKEQAPKVVAQGSGDVAEKILAIAKQQQVPIYQDERLARVLMQVEVNEVIPPDLYAVVAQILAAIWSVDQE